MAVRWLKKIGFSLNHVQKGVYVDGHKQLDVVASHNEFINYMFTQVLPYVLFKLYLLLVPLTNFYCSSRFSYTYDGPDLIEIEPLIPEGQKVHYPIFHNETCVHANNQSNFVWMRDGEQPLRGKSCGCIVHVSDFIIEHCRRLCLTDEEIHKQMKLPLPPLPPGSTNTATEPTQNALVQPAVKPKKAKNTKKSTTEGRTVMEQEQEWVPPPPPAPFTSYRIPSFDAHRIIYPGANYDPWWDMPQLITQVREQYICLVYVQLTLFKTKDAIKIFETKYPDGIAVFFFDCSSAHEAYPADALLAHKMNHGPGGKQPLMHGTTIPANGKPQSMVFPDGYSGVDKDGISLASRPKGMEQVLCERGLLSVLEKKHGSKLVSVCSDCKKSQVAHDTALKEAKSKEDKIEGSGIAGLNSHGAALDEEAEDLD